MRCNVCIGIVFMWNWDCFYLKLQGSVGKRTFSSLSFTNTTSVTAESLSSKYTLVTESISRNHRKNFYSAHALACLRYCPLEARTYGDFTWVTPRFHGNGATFVSGTARCSIGRWQLKILQLRPIDLLTVYWNLKANYWKKRKRSYFKCIQRQYKIQLFMFLVAEIITPGSHH